MSKSVSADSASHKNEGQPLAIKCLDYCPLSSCLSEKITNSFHLKLLKSDRNGVKQAPCTYAFDTAFAPRGLTSARFFFLPGCSFGNLGKRYFYAFMGHGDFILYSNAERKFEVRNVSLFCMT